MFSRRILFPLFSLEPSLTRTKGCYRGQIFVLRALQKADISFSENTLKHMLPLHSISGFLLSSCHGNLGHPGQVFGVLGCLLSLLDLMVVVFLKINTKVLVFIMFEHTGNQKAKSTCQGICLLITNPSS